MLVVLAVLFGFFFAIVGVGTMIFGFITAEGFWIMILQYAVASILFTLAYFLLMYGMN
jgi:hypothetical protein